MDTPIKRRWLVVDDDSSMVELTVEVLRCVPNREVIACDTPRRALKVCFAKPASFELAVSNFNRPGMDGLEVSRAVHESAPGAPGVKSTGRNLENARHGHGKPKALPLKPGPRNALLDIVRATLLSSGKICLK